MSDKLIIDYEKLVTLLVASFISLPNLSISIPIDAKSLKTIPQIIGINAAFSLSFLLVLSFVFLQMKGINTTFFLQIIGLFWLVLGFIFYKRNSSFRLELLDGILLIFGLTFWLF
jgi:hypothetical protein